MFIFCFIFTSYTFDFDHTALCQYDDPLVLMMSMKRPVWILLHIPLCIDKELSWLKD